MWSRHKPDTRQRDSREENGEGPSRLCIWWKGSSQEDMEENICLSVSEEEGLSKSRPILDRRSPHSITSYQPHITHLIYLPLPSHSSFLHCPRTSPLLLSSCCFLFFSSTCSPPIPSPPHLLHWLFGQSAPKVESSDCWLHSELCVLLFTAKHVQQSSYIHLCGGNATSL